RARGTYDDDPFGWPWRKAKGVREVHVQRDEGSAGRSARFVDQLIVASRQAFGRHDVHVMTALGQEWNEADIEVLVEFQLQSWDDSTGIGITRSRIISAAYAKAARISSA